MPHGAKLGVPHQADVSFVSPATDDRGYTLRDMAVSSAYRGIKLPSPKRDILSASRAERPTSPNGKLNRPDPYVENRHLDLSVRPKNLTGQESLPQPSENIDEIVRKQATPGSIPYRAGFGKLKYKVVGWSSQACGQEAKNLAVSNRKKHWCATGVGVEYVVLKLQETGLITSLEVDNKDCDGLEVYLSEVNRKTAFKLCKKIKFAAKGRKFVVRVGHVPCQYIKVCFLKNNLRPGPIIFSLNLIGMLSSRVEVELGPQLHNLLVSNSEDVIFGHTIGRMKRLGFMPFNKSVGESSLGGVRVHRVGGTPPSSIASMSDRQDGDDWI
jgi:hypothetical protein